MTVTVTGGPLIALGTDNCSGIATISLISETGDTAKFRIKGVGVGSCVAEYIDDNGNFGLSDITVTN